MSSIKIPLNLEKFEDTSLNAIVLKETCALRDAAVILKDENHLHDAMERTVTALKNLRQFPDYSDTEFRALFASLLFDLAEIHYELKNFKQCEKELDILFKVLDILVRLDDQRFGKFHILALELSARIIRSTKKALSLLVKHQISASSLYDKVNAGVAEASGLLADTLAEIGNLLASTGKEDEAVKFFAEAIKYSKKQNGKVTAKEINLTLRMAEVMTRTRSERQRAKRLLDTVLPHAISLKEIDLEREILALIETIENDADAESVWKSFMTKMMDMAETAKNKILSSLPEKESKENTEETKPESNDSSEKN